MDEITAEYAVAELAPAIPLRFRPTFRVAAKTDMGRVRENNEDKFEFYIPEDERLLAGRGAVFMVCDGMGGHAAGQIASELAAKTFLDVFYTHSADDQGEAISAAIRAANRYVLGVGQSVPGRRGMGTTLTALIVRQDEAWIGHVGDTRVYRWREASTERLTTDHTFVEESIRMGTLTPEAAAVHPHRHVLMRAIGAEDALVPEVLQFDARVGDRYLLCTDGLNNHVGDELIGEVLDRLGPSEAAWHLVERALQDGGSDNTTVLVVRIEDLVPAS
ncbi:MAG: protein phosphatase 2C domain-containing protein [Fimbriimonadaceae bacterium]|nr:protein phosphatase 2C domain-containing protein [Fimbriimonadaceae bacterium]